MTLRKRIILLTDIAAINSASTSRLPLAQAAHTAPLRLETDYDDDV